MSAADRAPVENARLRWEACGNPPNTAQRRRTGELPTMKSFRRWTLIVLCALLAGIVVRLRSKGESPPTTGGWRELEGPDFR